MFLLQIFTTLNILVKFCVERIIFFVNQAGKFIYFLVQIIFYLIIVLIHFSI